MKKAKIEIRQMAYATREALKTLRTNVQFCGDDKRVILVTSCVREKERPGVRLSLHIRSQS